MSVGPFVVMLTLFLTKDEASNHERPFTLRLAQSQRPHECVVTFTLRYHSHKTFPTSSPAVDRFLAMGIATDDSRLARMRRSVMKRKSPKSEETSIKAQQSGRRFSGNQQRELTRIQSKHPQVEETAEAMKQKDSLRPRKRNA